MPLITTRSAASARGLGFCQQTGPRTQPISGYELWLDSSDASSFTYSSGSVISRWTDRSANAYFFEPAATTNAPTRTGTQNSKSTVVFDGTNDFLASTAAASAWKFLHDGTQSTVIVVYKDTRLTINSSVDSTILDTTGYQFAIVSAGYPGYTLKTNNWYYNATSSYYSSNIASINSGVIQSGQSYPAQASVTGYINSSLYNTWNVLTNLLDANNATSSQKLNSYNSQSAFPTIADTSYTTNGWSSASTSNPGATLKIGWEQSGSSYPSFKGEIAEIIMYKRKLSVAEKTEMQTYLKTKWNI